MSTFDDELASEISPEGRGELEGYFEESLRKLSDDRQAAGELGELLGLDPAQVQGMINSGNPEEAYEDFLFKRRSPERLARRREWERNEARDAESIRESERADREKNMRAGARAKREFMGAASRLLLLPEDEAEQAIRNMSGGDRDDFTEDVFTFMKRQRGAPGSSEGESAGDPDMGDPLVDGMSVGYDSLVPFAEPYLKRVGRGETGVEPRPQDYQRALGDSMVPFDEPYLKDQSPAPGTSRMPREEEM